MTIRELKQIIEDLTDDTEILIEQKEISDIETINIEIHMDGRCYLVLSSLD
jgi:hypothetical protein